MAHRDLPLLPLLGSGLAVGLILSLPAIYNVWLAKQFFRSVPEELDYPITLGAHWLKEWAYKVATLPFLVAAVVVPIFIRPPVPEPLYQILFAIVTAVGPALLAIGCWQAGNARRDQKLILEEYSITYIQSPKHQITIAKNIIERYWIGVEGSLVLQLKIQRKRLLIPLAFENIGLINKSLLSVDR